MGLTPKSRKKYPVFHTFGPIERVEELHGPAVSTQCKQHWSVIEWVTKTFIISGSSVLWKAR
jgi:hypothetical protein